MEWEIGSIGRGKYRLSLFRIAQGDTLCDVLGRGTGQACVVPGRAMFGSMMDVWMAVRTRRGHRQPAGDARRPLVSRLVLHRCLQRSNLAR